MTQTTIRFTSLEDDNRFPGHEFEVTLEINEAEDWELKTIQSVGMQPINTQVMGMICDNCLVNDDLERALKDEGIILDNFAVDTFLQEAGKDQLSTTTGHSHMILDTDYSETELAA
tara:strand:- start:425 stop:772 length:348 start_codon:yes stop_codon:yes gene_type:complete